MKSILKALALLAVVAAASGCQSVSDLNDRGHRLYDADPSAYDAMPGATAPHFEIFPQYNVYGS